MSFHFYSEIRGSLPKQDPKNINPETLKKLFQLFTKEKNFFEKLRESTIWINHPSYTERTLFSTLNGYTSTELFMSRLTPKEKQNILLLSDIITNQIRKKIRNHDFYTLMAIGSSTYPESYWSELQTALDNIDYEIISQWDKTICEERNASYENITKEQLQKTINQRGNDIDLVLTWFWWWTIAVQYWDYYKNNIKKGIINRTERDKIDEIIQKFVVKAISQEDFLELVIINDREWFMNSLQELENWWDYGRENRASILYNKYEISLTEQWKNKIWAITPERLWHILTTRGEVIKSKEEYIRDTYLHTIIPQLLQSHNIPFTIEWQREDWSYYDIYHTTKQIIKQKYLNPFHSKDWCLIIQFPDCRPIHLNIDTTPIEKLYHHEEKFNSSFSILSHNHIEREKFLTKERDKNFSIPEHLTLEEQIQYVKHNKPKIQRDKIIERKKKKQEDQEKLKWDSNTLF